MTTHPLSIHEVAARIGVPVPTLRYWRQQGRGPVSFKLSGKHLRYREEDVEAWLAEQYAATSTREAS